MSGSAIVTPGYLIQDFEKATNAKFRQMATPVVQIAPGQVTATELSPTINNQLTALQSAITTVTAKTSSFTAQTTDKGTLFNVAPGAADCTVTLPSAVTAGNGWYIWLQKSDTGTGRILTTPTTTPNPLLLTKLDHKCLLYTDSVSYFAMLFLISIDPSGNLVLSSQNSITLSPTNLIQLGGSSASFPASKRISNTWAFRLADDSADASISASNGIFSGFVSNNADISLGSMTGTVNIDWSKGNSFTGTLVGNVTITFTNTRDSETVEIELIEDGTGTRTVTWPGGIKWYGGTPTMTATANKRDLYVVGQKAGTLSGRYNQNA